MRPLKRDWNWNGEVARGHPDRERPQQRLHRAQSFQLRCTRDAFLDVIRKEPMVLWFRPVVEQRR